MEAELWDAYEVEPSDANRNALAEFYLHIVERRAKRMAAKVPASPFTGYREFYSAGFEGLLDAIRGFDRKRGLKFSTYALRRIDGAMGDYLRGVDWVPRLERTRQKQGGKVLRMESIDTVLAEMGEKLVYLAGTIESTESCQASQQYQTDLHFRELLKGLSRNERLLLICYYRLDMKMREIGQHLGISESRVSQMHSQLIERLRRNAEPVDDAGPIILPMVPPEPKRQPIIREAAVSPLSLKPEPRPMEEPEVTDERPSMKFDLIRTLTPTEVDDRIQELESELRILKAIQHALRAGKPVRASVSHTRSTITGGTTARQRVTAFLRDNGPSSVPQIVESLGLNQNTVAAMLSRSDEFVNPRQGVWELKEAA